MRYRELIAEALPKVQAVEWPTDMAWRIEFKKFSSLPSILDIRRGKLFAMPFRNWEETYYKLTLKETSKVKYMNTSVVRVPPDALVGDMQIIDIALKYFQVKNDPAGSMKRNGLEIAQEYEKTAVSYAEFCHNPEMFKRPEILLDRATVHFLPYKVTIAGYTNGSYQLGLSPK